MRIISGELRGRRLKAPPGRVTRPMLDHQKEAIFNILRESLPCSGVLDVFAGSGALGLEALSRGAERATFVERGRGPLQALRSNLEALGVKDRARVVVTDARRLRFGDLGHPLGLVFLDPPFPLVREEPRVMEEMLTRLVRAAEFEPGARVIYRVPVDAAEPEFPAGLAEEDRRVLGDSRVFFLAPASR